MAEAGGALDWTGLTPYEITSSLQQQGAAAGYDPLIFVAHPRAGILGYFDQYGLDPYGGTKGIGKATADIIRAAGGSVVVVGSPRP